MKTCPQCKIVYPTDTLFFCLVDGTPLSEPLDAEKTEKINLILQSDPGFHSAPTLIKNKKADFAENLRNSKQTFSANIVDTWFRKYLNTVIFKLKDAAVRFSHKDFFVMPEKLGDTTFAISKVQFFDFETWEHLNSTITASQFLRTFPDIKSELENLIFKIKEFVDLFESLTQILSKAPELERKIRSNYQIITTNRRYPESAYYQEFDKILQMYAGEWMSQYYPQIDTHQKELKILFARMKAYGLLELELDPVLPFPDVAVFSSSKSDLFETFLESKDEIDKHLTILNQLIGEIAEDAKSLSDRLDDFRFTLADKYNIALEE